MSHDTSRQTPRTIPSEPAGPFSATAGLSSTVALVADVVAVLVFTLIGSFSHNGSDGFSIGGWLQTSWPFILGLAVGWALLYTGKLRRAPGTGVLLLGSTWFIGIIVRSLVNMSLAWGFVITSLIFLGIVMIGWRVVASLVTQRARS
ncbi:MAG TPA: DUF3054 domain-containing protein [Candidatus Corynebacterium avicola]|uniref:DUF3054 domain-containing protein n=1 Tax=Candidatus Corynebacterium avicola TaxID=2838527 RepID=A0A9D1RQR0_9CORY|nr:DUF3054 domain-containing protein [Candidatus Corynebacterium avicola]